MPTCSSCMIKNCVSSCDRQRERDGEDEATHTGEAATAAPPTVATAWQLDDLPAACGVGAAPWLCW